MFKILIIILLGNVMENYYIVSDFNSPNTPKRWLIINDGVMGGISSSRFQVNADGTATFSGTLLPDNNGGFASVRSRLEKAIDKDFKGVFLRVKGDGQQYSLRFRTDADFDGMAYQAKFVADDKDWKIIKLPFNEFKPTFRGRYVPGQPELTSSNIKQIGFLIADKQFGDFNVDIDWIKLY